VHITRGASTLTWTIEAGIYTVYFVDHVVFYRSFDRNPYSYDFDQAPDYEIVYRIELLSSGNSAAYE
jgi:hypothetical protein